MKKSCVLSLCAIAFVTIPALPNSGLAQGKSLKDQLVGTWIYVSSTGKRDDGSSVSRPSLQGAATYTVDEATKTINANIETSTFANLVGAPNQRRIISSSTADEMKFMNPRTPAGVTLEFVWKRAK
jgi:hypothetical protein